MEAVSCFVLVESQSVQAIADVSAADLTGSCKELLADCEMTAVVSVPIWQSGDWETVKQRFRKHCLGSRKNRRCSRKLYRAVGERQTAGAGFKCAGFDRRK